MVLIHLDHYIVLYSNILDDWLTVKTYLTFCLDNNNKISTLRHVGMVIRLKRFLQTVNKISFQRNNCVF